MVTVAVQLHYLSVCYGIDMVTSEDQVPGQANVRVLPRLTNTAGTLAPFAVSGIWKGLRATERLPSGRLATLA
jgi:hypothetical protein